MADSRKSPSLLAPDDRLARPEYGEFGEEVIDGKRMECLPAEAAHADPQCRLASLVTVCLTPGYVASTELLTRTDEESDFATDVCVRREGADPETNGRYLEEISFEVANTQRRKELERVRVPKLLRAGVRRIFAVMVREKEVLEWSAKNGKWITWESGEEIQDPLFIQPLEVAAMLDAAQVDPLISKAQLAKREPYLMGVLREARTEGEAKGRAKGEAKGLAQAVLRVYESHGIRLDEENRQAVLECRDTSLLTRWLDKAVTARSAADILDELEEVD